MGLPSVFEVFHLAIGPSTVFTTGALRIGQTFRELLLSSPYRTNNRILIELLGDFSKNGLEYNSDQAVVAGLGGFTFEGPCVKLKTFYSKIKENGYLSFMQDQWPFNPESDLIFSASGKNAAHPNCIRFHLINSSSGQPIFQTEYYSMGNGVVKGIGVMDPGKPLDDNSLKSFSEIRYILSTEKISLMEYVISGECSRHRISRDHFQKRMLATWKLMISNIYHGLKAPNSANPSFGGDQTRAGLYALALSDEILNNRPVITSPTCAGSAILPAVFRHMQEKFLFSDEKMIEGLVVGGLFGSLILDQFIQANQMVNIQIEIAFSAIMASAGISYLIGGSTSEIENAATFAALLYGGTDQRMNSFESESFSLRNSLVAQTLPSLVDLSRVQIGGAIPKFDDVLNDLFRR